MREKINLYQNINKNFEQMIMRQNQVIDNLMEFTKDAFDNQMMKVQMNSSIQENIDTNLEEMEKNLLKKIEKIDFKSQERNKIELVKLNMKKLQKK